MEIVKILQITAIIIELLFVLTFKVLLIVGIYTLLKKI